MLGEVQTGQPNEKLKGRTSGRRGLYIIPPGLLTTGCSAWKRSEMYTEAQAVTSAKVVVHSTYSLMLRFSANFVSAAKQKPCSRPVDCQFAIVLILPVSFQ